MRCFLPDRKSYFLIIFFVLIGTASIASIAGQTTTTPTHFITVWQGENGQNHMNFMVVSALLEQQQLAGDDEIGIFSGLYCVGAAKLTKAINPSDYTTFVNILASQSDGGNNGFVENDTIIFKIWDNKNQQESKISSVVYRKDQPTWLTTGRFSASATSVVEIAYSTNVTQTVHFINGSNLFSTYVVPTNADVSMVMKSLCDLGLLVKVQDELANTFSYSTKKKVWINGIGSIKKTEGYLVSVNMDCTLQITGKMIDLPLDIPLQTGWNYISFPRTAAVDAMKIIQPLIDLKKLIKVQDELGNSIEVSRKSGAWINNIGSFYPGKAYKIDVSSAAVLTIQQ